MVAAGIAGANFWRVCGAAIRIAAPLFVLPIAFVYNPGLITMSVGGSTLLIGLLVVMGAITMIYGLNYPFEMRLGLRVILRIALSTLGVFVMVYPNQLVKAAGILVFAGVFVGEKVVTRGLKLPFLEEVSR